jgi:STAS-like domain of unknown function (DUF4325)
MLLKIASDFSTAPGPRRKTEGGYSGEEFRQDILLPKLLEAIEKHSDLTVDLDGTAGYGTSFLEESFGGLIRENHLTLATLNKTLKIVSLEEPDLEAEIREYMRDAESERVKAGG